jgi:peptide/nickel transport system permease protein
MNARLAVAAAILLPALLAALFAPLLAAAIGYDEGAVDLTKRYLAPSLAHPLGTDELGRDVAMRLAFGARVSLTVGIAAALAAASMGTAIGLVSGYAGGRVDAVLMRMTDAVLSLPVLPVLIVLAAVDPAKLGLPDADAAGLWRIVAIVAAFGWPKVARLVRAATLS